MKSHAIAIRCSLLVGMVCVLASGRARATSCLNDIDCPTAECGGEVCDYSTGTPTCKPAGTQPKGMDGWCTSNSDCKCASLGAKCDSSAVFCTFTKPSDAPGGGKGGNSGVAGASGATGGATAATGGSGAAGKAGGDDGSSGGCSVGGARTLGGGLGCAILASLGLAAVIVRRRRR